LITASSKLWALNLRRGENLFKLLEFSMKNFLFFSIKLPVTYNEKDVSHSNFSTYMEHSNKMSRFILRQETLNFHSNLNSGTSSLYFMEENFAIFHFSLYFLKESPLNKVVNKKIGQLLQAGIIQKSEEERLEAVKRAAKHKDEENAEILTMDHLGLCFIAILICLGFSCIVFAAECLIGYSRR
jgi:hypothetical protein